MLVRQPTRRPTARRGVTLVECALLLTIFLLFLFGVFEYARYLLVLHTTSNAARDGARYAIVRSSFPEALVFTKVTAPAPDYTSTRPGFDVPFITTYTRNRMGGVDRMIDGFQVRVFPCDTAVIYDDPPVIRPKEQPKVGPPADPTCTWNNAQFSERIAVRVSGKYRPIVPAIFVNIIHANASIMSSEVDVKVTALMGSEG